jgi:hypothetical protein
MIAPSECSDGDDLPESSRLCRGGAGEAAFPDCRRIPIRELSGLLGVADQCPAHLN